MDPLPREFRHVARCGRCGQLLWTVIDGDSLGPSWLNDLKRGYRFDPEGRIWRPTATHLSQRRAASDRLRNGTATDFDRVQLRHGGFGRRSRPFEGADRDGPRRLRDIFAGAHVASGVPTGARFGVTADLPVAVQCPRCGAENDLDDPVPQG